MPGLESSACNQGNGVSFSWPRHHAHAFKLEPLRDNGAPRGNHKAHRPGIGIKRTEYLPRPSFYVATVPPREAGRKIHPREDFGFHKIDFHCRPGICFSTGTGASRAVQHMRFSSQPRHGLRFFGTSGRLGTLCGKLSPRGPFVEFVQRLGGDIMPVRNENRPYPTPFPPAEASCPANAHLPHELIKSNGNPFRGGRLIV